MTEPNRTEQLEKETWNKLKYNLNVYKLIPPNDFIFEGVLREALNKERKETAEEIIKLLMRDTDTLKGKYPIAEYLIKEIKRIGGLE